MDVTSGPGRLCDQSSVRQLQLDDATFTYIVDGAMGMVPARFLRSIPPSYWQRHGDDLDAEGLVPMSAGGLLIEREGQRLLIDTGLGPLVDDDGTMRSNSGDLLKVLAILDVRPQDIEIVAFTHLHRDHTGWAFTGSNSGRDRPTFPEARYVLADAEMASLSLGAPRRYTSDIDGLRSSLDAMSGTVLIDDGDEVAPGITAMVTPGHSPGHTSYIVTLRSGQRVVVVGDMFHTPPQISNTAWTSDPDSDPAAVPSARTRVLAELLVPDTVGFAFHFGDQPFGRVVKGAGDQLAWQAIATTALLPPPRQL
jgi:glyoxylase-like metal-dependent hydrolase (beta-lactamase superfamily II)